MGLFGKSKEEQALEQKVLELESQLIQMSEQLRPEHNDIYSLQLKIKYLSKERSDLEEVIRTKNQTITELNHEISEKQKELIQLDDEILYQSYSLYKPVYDFATSEEYKSKLDEVRSKQKAMIKDNSACSFSEAWTVDGSKAKGAKMTKDNIKQVLRCFNNECENAIDRVKYNNIESMRSRIQKSYETLNKLNEVNQISIRAPYFNLKIQELNLAIEFALKKQEEKEAQKKAREELREQQKLEQELKAAREKIEKERKHYSNALSVLQTKLQTAAGNEKLDLEIKLSELQSDLAELDKEERTVDYREQNAKAGYVYVISNIGAFGENVYKIGMTRRLEPMERVDELGDASVPFPFDVHALIFSEDAPKLESALHKAFDDKKVNMVNGRKEFFCVTIDEIQKVVNENYDKTVDFIKTPSADQFRQSQILKLEREHEHVLS